MGNYMRRDYNKEQDYVDKTEDDKTEDDTKRFELYKKLANQGLANAQYNLARCYLEGKGVERDKEWGITWLKLSAMQGDLDAKMMLAYCYCNGGVGVHRNISRAIKLWTELSEKGNSEAQFKLAVCYNNGDGVSKDINKAIELLTASANQGYSMAQCNLGFCYYKGDGVAQDKERAFELYKKSADQGNAIAQYNIGECYENGDGVAQDKEKAVHYYTLSAMQGDKDALERLEIMKDL